MEMDRKLLIKKIIEMTNVSEDEVREYFAIGDEYIDGLPSDIDSIDGDERLDYIYEKSNLYPDIIEKISEAEFELVYR